MSLIYTKEVGDFVSHLVKQIEHGVSNVQIPSPKSSNTRVSGSFRRAKHVNDVDVSCEIQEPMSQDLLRRILKSLKRIIGKTGHLGHISFPRVDKRVFRKDLATILGVSIAELPKKSSRLRVSERDIHAHVALISHLLMGNDSFSLTLYVPYKHGHTIIFDISFFFRNRTSQTHGNSDWRQDRIRKDLLSQQMYWVSYQVLKVLRKNRELGDLERDLGYYAQIESFIRFLHRDGQDSHVYSILMTDLKKLTAAKRITGWDSIESLQKIIKEKSNEQVKKHYTFGIVRDYLLLHGLSDNT